LRLFGEQGYHDTTIEQIAEAAEVSPSTFFRYFPTKEDVVLRDDLDVLMLEAFQAQPFELRPIAAMRAAMRVVFDQLSAEDLEQFRESTALSISVPEVRARAFDEFATGIQTIAAAIAQRAGRDADDFAVRNLAGAIIGVVMSATLGATADPHAKDIFAPIDAALAHLEAGLPI
jgi:AcrR family transcriptional regulator